ncbi:MAG: phosphopyruvate hydratase [Candidatus Micrarchaeota archaeon]
MRIKRVAARQILDSRGNPTVECDILLTDGSAGRAAVPSGASTGKHEAMELRDGGRPFSGKGVSKAVSNVNSVIARKVVGMDAEDQRALDGELVRLDGTKDKRRLGANALLAVSLAACRAQAASDGLQLHSRIARMSGRSPAMPVPFANVLNGGRHAGGGLRMQECMVAPVGAKSFSKAARMVAEVYHELKAALARRFGGAATNVGDEGGFAPPLKDTPAAFEMLLKTIEECGYGGGVRVAADYAATEFFDRRSGKYSLDGKTLSPGALLEYHAGLIRSYGLVSVEDPFHEEDFASFAGLAAEFKGRVQVVADDLTVTNPARLAKAIAEKSGNCLLLKVNQIGTLSEALEAARMARSGGWRVMVSHRSGETEDSFIADLAVGIGCGQVKLGAPCRGERTAKYNQLLRIEETMPAGAFSWKA